MCWCYKPLSDFDNVFVLDNSLLDRLYFCFLIIWLVPSTNSPLNQKFRAFPSICIMR